MDCISFPVCNDRNQRSKGEIFRFSFDAIIQGGRFFAKRSGTGRKAQALFGTKDQPFSRNRQSQLNENDLVLLAKVWNSLSPDFKQLYQQATQIPSQDTFYVSPSGHFEVYYTTKGEEPINSADNYGFGAAGNWRTKNNQPNGVPDYVDEVAWDLDSAWSMEIGRFQYIQPIPYTDATHTSNRFKVVIASLGEGYYGETFPGAPGRITWNLKPYRNK